MSPHYLVKRKSRFFAVYNSYNDINVVLDQCITKKVSISPLSAVWLVSNVQLTEFLTVFPSSKEVVPTRASCCVVCVFDYLASSLRFVVFHKVMRQHYSGEMSDFTLREISSVGVF